MQNDSFSIYSLLIQFFRKKEPIQKVKAGTVLFQEKDPVEYVYLLLKGSISLGRVHLRGKEFILKILNSRETLWNISFLIQILIIIFTQKHFQIVKCS